MEVLDDEAERASSGGKVAILWTGISDAPVEAPSRGIERLDSGWDGAAAGSCHQGSKRQMANGHGKPRQTGDP